MQRGQQLIFGQRLQPGRHFVGDQCRARLQQIAQVAADGREPLPAGIGEGVSMLARSALGEKVELLFC
jgi:hypothetical protein